jgi:hypothetical protein
MTDKELQAFEQLKAEYVKLSPSDRLEIIEANTEGISIDDMIDIFDTSEDELLEHISAERLDKYYSDLHDEPDWY